MEVTIQDLGSIGELIAAVATVATLVYLAIQIRANTTAIHSEARGRSHAEAIDASAILGGNRDAASVFARGLADRDWMLTATRAVIRLLMTPGGREYWGLHCSSFSTPFQAFIEEHLVVPADKVSPAAQKDATNDSA